MRNYKTSDFSVDNHTVIRYCMNMNSTLNSEVEADRLPSFKCPECNSGKLKVIIETWMALSLGSDIRLCLQDVGDDKEWNENSLMECYECGHQGIAEQFTSAGHIDWQKVSRNTVTYSDSSEVLVALKKLTAWVGGMSFNTPVLVSECDELIGQAVAAIAKSENR